MLKQLHSCEKKRCLEKHSRSKCKFYCYKDCLLKERERDNLYAGDYFTKRLRRNSCLELWSNFLNAQGLLHLFFSNPLLMQKAKATWGCLWAIFIQLPTFNLPPNEPPIVMRFKHHCIIFWKKFLERKKTFFFFDRKFYANRRHVLQK